MDGEDGSTQVEEPRDRKPWRKRFKKSLKQVRNVVATIAVLVSVVVSLISISLAKDATTVARDANTAAREGNDIASTLSTIDALSFQREERALLPRVIVNDGGNGDGGDGYARGTGWNPSQYPAIVLGADLEFSYSNVEGDNETSNLALQKATTASCVLQVWSPADDGTASSSPSSCSEPVSVGPGDVLWVSAGIPEDQKKMFCARHPKGVAGFSIEVRHALYNVSNDIPEISSPGSVNLVCDGRSFDNAS